MPTWTTTCSNGLVENYSGTQEQLDAAIAKMASATPVKFDRRQVTENQWRIPCVECGVLQEFVNCEKDSSGAVLFFVPDDGTGAPAQCPAHGHSITGATAFSTMGVGEEPVTIIDVVQTG